MAEKSYEEEHPTRAFGWAARDQSGVLSPFKFSRRNTSCNRSTGEKDVRFKVLYCGICHSDLHMAKNEWGTSMYPLVPGHEIVGEVTEVGSKVEKFKVGDKVGVGCMVGSCHSCDSCNSDLENYCPKMILTYSTKYHDGTTTYGGYSDSMVTDEHFVVRIPDNLPLDAAAPLLCAGITVYSPLRFFNLDKPGMHVGVVGLGGLGHVAVKFAKAMGVKVTVISTSPKKKQEALEHLGADLFLVSRDQDEMQAAMGTMDGVIDTVSAMHPILPLISLLKTQGKLVLVGAPEKPLELPVFPLIMGIDEFHVIGLAGRKIVGGSCIGGMKETQEMIDFAAKNNITADIEVISMDYVNTAMERLLKTDIHDQFEKSGVFGAQFNHVYQIEQKEGKMAEKSYEEEHPTKAFGWAARDQSGVLSPFKFSRRSTGEKDVRFKVLFCGICHTDLHMAKNDWGMSTYPLVPGKVEKIKVGDKVGVGCMVGSCRSCDSCNSHLENYCPKMILSYASKYHDGTTTYGGYSDIMVVDEHFLVHIPDNLPLDAAAPLLCAGITVYSPLRFFNLDKPGMHVGVVGLGGLGHVAVKFAKAMGVKVTVISTSPKKKQEALEHLGADSFLVSREQDEMQAAMGTMDGVIDTVSAIHPILPLISLLKTQGKLVLVGAPEKPLELPVFPLIMAPHLFIIYQKSFALYESINGVHFGTLYQIEQKEGKMAEKSYEEEHPTKAFGWAARDQSGVLSPFKFSRSKVEKIKVGDKVGVGCMVGSCRSCDSCNNHLENYCPKMILSYASKYHDGTTTYGGYSDIMVVDEHFLVHIPDNLPLDAAAPLLCAGITVYSPLRFYGLDKPGMHVGVVGLGGLGHVAVKFAKAMGVKVTVISTSPKKKQEALEHLGADSFLVSRDQDEMQAAMGTMDGVIDTVSAVHPILPLISLLKTQGKLVLVGAPEKPLELPVFPLIMGRKIVGGSGIGGMKETQEMIDFASKNNITADIEVISMDYVSTAMERLSRTDVRYRFVIDIGNTIGNTMKI
ncbi:hypothetical protein NC653_022983 [Populus alba x Populus x berolinensis]|uniref:mannitol dehydrogenase n=1 Tax=Populus alba x Populus x berolinensis TaxID=444605 RepID=A0AAD6MG17_9ROSI|nr:hypothetical protein NC653_022983 [Populus alba x Populus x berolinensis]